MAIRKLSVTSPARHQSDLVDELLNLYVTWREDATAVADTYRVWSAAPASEEAWRFSSYLSALELEERSASQYAQAVANVGRSLDAGRR
jgi:hypothetical protein